MATVVFARPLRTLEESYGDLAAAGSTEASQGLCSLASVTREAGHEAHIVDATLQRLDNEAAADAILRLKPMCVGLSALTATAHDAGAIAAAIKRREPSVKVILGGVHVTALPDETMGAFPAVDIAVLGEGEETIVDLLRALETGGDALDVRGLMIRQGERLIRTEPRPLIRRLDDLPFPAWDLLPGYPQCCRPPAWSPNLGESGLIITSRGCTGKCTFCDRTCFGSVCRAHSAEYVIRLLAHLKGRFGIRHVRILDDNFTLWPKRLRSICERMMDERMGLVWSCFARVDTVDADVLRLMKEAGCAEISYGIESGSQRILDTIRKEVTLGQIREAVRLTRSAGIEIIGFFMLGHPGETPETIRETIELALELDLDYFKALYVTPFPGSELYRTAESFGTLDRDWRALSTYHCPFVPRGMTRDELIGYRKLMFRKFYLRPKMIWRHALRCRDPRELYYFARGAASLAKFWVKRRAS